MDVLWLVVAGALMLLLGLSALGIDALRRRGNPFPRILADLTTSLLQPNAAGQGAQSRGYVGGPHAPGPVGRLRHRLRSRTTPRIVPVVLVAGITATCAALGLYATTTLGTPQAPEGTAVIAVAQFKGAPKVGSPTTAFSSQLARAAGTGGLDTLIVRESGKVVTSWEQAEDERARAGADALWWGEVGPGGAITASLALSPQFRPWQPVWAQLKPYDLSLVLFPSIAQLYLPAGQGVDALVPLSLAIAHLKLGQYPEAARASYGSKATILQLEERYPSGKNASAIQMASILEAASDFARQRYQESAVTLDALEGSGLLTFEGLVNRSAARLASGDVNGARSDADRVLGMREATNEAQALAYLARGRAALRPNDVAAALSDLAESARLDPQSTAAKLERAEALYRQSQPDAARVELQALIERSPGAAPAYRLLGLTMLMLGQPAEAMPSLDGAEALYNAWIDALRKEEASAQASSNGDRAQWATDTIVELDKDLAGIYLYQGMSWADLARQDPPETFFGGLWRRIRGEPTRLERAVEKMLAAQRLDPQRPDVPLQLGNVYTRMGDRGAAGAALQEAQRLNPTAPEPYLTLARLQLSQANPNEAITTLRQLLAQNAAYFPAYDEIYNIYKGGGDEANATATLQSALQITPTSASDYLWRGRFLHRLGDTAGAIEAARVAATDPQMWEAHLLLGSLLREAGQAQGALYAFQQALTVQPNNQEALLGAAQLYVLAGQAEDAQKLFERLVLNWPNNVDARIAFSQLLSLRGQQDRALAEAQKAVELAPERADAHFFLGQVYDTKKMWSASAEQYRVAAERDPQRFDAFIRWAHALFADDRYAESAEVSRRAIEMRDGDPQGFRWRAEAELAMGNPASALESLARGLELAPQDENMLALAARAYMLTGDEPRAESFASRAVELDPRGIAGSNALGEIYLQQGRPEAALQAFERGLATAPGSVQLIVAQGRAYAAMGEYAEALSLYNEALKLDPAYAPAHLHAGSMYVTLGNWDEAFEQFRAAVQLRPNWPEALSALGNAYLQRKDLANAQAAFARATQQAPGLVDAWFGLGLASRNRGQDQEALKALEQAVNLDPRKAEAWLYLGLSYEQLGQRAQAAGAFTQALETTGDQGIREQAEKGLSRVK